MKNPDIPHHHFTYEMNSQSWIGAREGQLLTRVVPWPVVMADGVDDTAVAPGCRSRLAARSRRARPSCALAAVQLAATTAEHAQR